MVVSARKALAAYWRWNSRKYGAFVSLILLDLSAIIWYGFALPLGALLGAAELVLLVLAWRTPDRRGSLVPPGHASPDKHRKEIKGGA